MRSIKKLNFSKEPISEMTWIIIKNSLLVLFVLLSVKPLGVRADVFDYFVVRGADVSDGSAANFDSDALTKLGASDDSRIQSDGNWPTGGFFDEGRFIEFVFEPNIQSGALIEKTVVTFEWRRSGTLDEAKLEIWDGQNFITKPLPLPKISNSDFSEQLDLTSNIDTPAKLNGLKIRFLAYRNTAVNTKTSHDFFKLSVSGSRINPPEQISPSPGPQTFSSSPTPSFLSPPPLPNPPTPSPSVTLFPPSISATAVISPTFTPDFVAPAASPIRTPRQLSPQQSPGYDFQEAMVAKTIDEIKNQSESINTNWTENKYLFSLAAGIIALVIYFRLRARKTNS